MKVSKSPKNNVIDPVCGMTVDSNHRGILATYAGCTYYFCAEGCRKAFEANPEKYLHAIHPHRKGWWGRYLDRLEKATGGKSMQCH